MNVRFKMLKIVLQHFIFPEKCYRVYLPKEIDTEDLNGKYWLNRMIVELVSNIKRPFLYDSMTGIDFTSDMTPVQIDIHQTSKNIKGGRELDLMANEDDIRNAYSQLVNTLKRYDLI